MKGIRVNGVFYSQVGFADHFYDMAAIVKTVELRLAFLHANKVLVGFPCGGYYAFIVIRKGSCPKFLAKVLAIKKKYAKQAHERGEI
ncbi:MAG: hypothetical protein AAGC78_10405 [Cellvibrio sp.]|uniref:hypothetical protein n=1 Tax=Cellvibrio sp. TaxID=1965322 RepID=UPI0031A7D8CE